MSAQKTPSYMAINALLYVARTHGGATQANFEEDHEPIGAQLWNELFEEGGFITLDSAGRIFLTDAGRTAIAEATGREP
jgi:hypothetical protein